MEVEKKKAVAAAKEPKAKAPKGAKNDILSAVRQATLSDPEVQALIDVLLLKQVPVTYRYLVCWYNVLPLYMAPVGTYLPYLCTWVPR